MYHGQVQTKTLTGQAGFKKTALYMSLLETSAFCGLDM